MLNIKKRDILLMVFMVVVIIAACGNYEKEEQKDLNIHQDNLNNKTDFTGDDTGIINSIEVDGGTYSENGDDNNDKASKSNHNNINNDSAGDNDSEIIYKSLITDNIHYENDGISVLNAEDRFRAVLGENIILSAVTKGADRLVDNSGMSGLWAINHLHNAAAANMYFTDYLGEEGAVILDAGSIEALGLMYIWNYNEKDKLDTGMREVEIYYSSDNVNWTKLGTKSFELARCSEEDNENYRGNLPVTLNDGFFSPIDFAGIPARFIKIIPVTNWGGEGCGLSEVRIFRHKKTDEKGSVLIADAFTPKQEGKLIKNAFNNTGMKSLTQMDTTHNNNSDSMWLSEGSAKDSMIIINLDGNYPLEEMKIWNYNNPDMLKYGVKEFALYYTTSDPCSINKRTGINFNSGNWKKIGDYTIDMASGESEIQASLTIKLDNLHAQHLKIVIKSNYAGEETGFGLSEVRLMLGSGWAVEPERNWSGLLSSSGTFPYQNSNFDQFSPYGWLAADGIHAINITTDEYGQSGGYASDDTTTFFTFQDTMQGSMKNYSSFSPNYGYDISHRGMINESYLTVKGADPDPRKSQFVIKGYSDDANLEGDLVKGSYWLADSTIVGDYLYTLGNHFSGLSILGADFLKFKINKETGFPDYQNQYPEIVHEYNKNYMEIDGVEINFDTLLEGIGEDKDYIYTFARGLRRGMVVAKLKKEDFPLYENIWYWSGEDWSDDINVVVKQEAQITSYRPGNEFSVSYMTSAPFEGSYINIFTRESIDGVVQMALADSLTEGFAKPIDLYYASEKYKLSLNEYNGYDYKGNVMFEEWNYNAKAQPAISREGELLITYHFSAGDLPPINDYGFTSTTIEYSHPVFLRLYLVK